MCVICQQCQQYQKKEDDDEEKKEKKQWILKYTLNQKPWEKKDQFVARNLSYLDLSCVIQPMHKSIR